MWLYALQRFGMALLVCVLSVTVLFCIAYVIPGDPTAIALGPRATPEMREALRIRMGLGQPIYMQLYHFFSSLFRGDLGVDVWSNRPVIDIVKETLPKTMILAITGLGWAALIGIPLGCYSAIRRNKLDDRIIGIFSIAMISTPSFLTAIYALLVFAVTLNWLPAIGAGEPGNFGDQVVHLILPAFAIGFAWVGYLSRLVRATMLEVLNETHIRFSRAFGLPEWKITLKYALKIAVLPTITLLGMAYGGLLSSAVFAEIIFNRPGVGQSALAAVNTRNYPVMMGLTLSTIFVFTMCTLIADLLVAALDPRIRKGL